jgi:hypothetical protein
MCFAFIPASIKIAEFSFSTKKQFPPEPDDKADVLILNLIMVCPLINLFREKIFIKVFILMSSLHIMRKVAEIIGNILFFGFLIIGMGVLLFGSNSEWLLLFLLFSFLGSWLIAYIMKKRNIYDKGLYWMLINLFLWLNILGEVGFFYDSSVLYYDKLIHFFSGVLLAAIVYKDYSVNLKPRKEYVFFSILGMFALWEIYEFILFVFLNYPAVGVFENGVMIMSPYEDTIYDLISGTLGVLLYISLKNRIKNIIKRH